MLVTVPINHSNAASGYPDSSCLSFSLARHKHKQHCQLGAPFCFPPTPAHECSFGSYIDELEYELGEM